jgi:hypothetical protein
VQFLFLPTLGFMLYGLLRLRRAGRMTVRLACVSLGTSTFLVVFFEGTPNDSFTGESAIAGAVVGVAVTVVLMLLYWIAYWLRKLRTGGRARDPDSIPW